MTKLKYSGQTLLELVVGMSLITVIVGALAVTTTYSLRNSQFSRSQAQATKLAQEYIEKIKTIKSSNYGICLSGLPSCARWDDLWTSPTHSYYNQFNSLCGSGCHFTIVNNCRVGTSQVLLCLQQTTDTQPISLNNGFSYEIIIANDSTPTQKKVTARVSWSDNTGTHASDLVTVLSRF